MASFFGQMRLLIIAIISLGLLSCSKPADTSSNLQQADSLKTEIDSTTTYEFDYDAQFKLDNYLTTDSFDEKTNDLIDFECAILIYPTSEQIDEKKKNEGEEDFYIGADDSNWYQAMAIEKIDSAGIKTITASGRYLRLRGQNKTWDLDIRKKNLPAWNLIFFKPTKEPKIISTVDLTVDETKNYFEIRD
ncbi:MAG: hypothetical protein QY309_13405 [Cyclobacteriaceae bacterium]|nr:MAG: hypothetical protein QY309_13405 [Cyclobacteriaceae bacterium]